MAEARKTLQIGLLLAFAIMLVIGATRVRAKRNLAVATVDDIEAQVAALDPITRATVIARLSVDAGKTVQDKRRSS